MKKTMSETKKEINKETTKIAWNCINKLVECEESLAYCGHAKNLKKQNLVVATEIVCKKLIQFAKQIQVGKIQGQELPGSNFYDPMFESKHKYEEMQE